MLWTFSFINYGRKTPSISTFATKAEAEQAALRVRQMSGRTVRATVHPVRS